MNKPNEQPQTVTELAEQLRRELHHQLEMAAGVHDAATHAAAVDVVKACGSDADIPPAVLERACTLIAKQEAARELAGKIAQHLDAAFVQLEQLGRRRLAEVRRDAIQEAANALQDWTPATGGQHGRGGKPGQQAAVLVLGLIGVKPKGGTSG